jgi:hypothetical protein
MDGGGICSGELLLLSCCICSDAPTTFKAPLLEVIFAA